MISPAKKKTAYVLFTAAVVLLTANLFMDKLLPISTNVDQEIVLSGITINELFLKAVNNFGLEKSWVVERKILSKPDSLFSSYKIRLPRDLPIPVVISEVKSVFSNDSVEIKSLELKTGGETKLEIYSGGVLKLSSNFNYDKSLFRKRGSVGFIVENISLDNEDDSLLFEVPEIFAALLIPSIDNKSNVEFIGKKNKQFAVLLNDEIDDLEFKLNENYSNNRIKNSVKSIVGSFPKAIFFVIDDESELYSSKVFSLIAAEIEKRKIKILRKSDFYKLQYDEHNDLLSSFDNLFKRG